MIVKVQCTGRSCWLFTTWWMNPLFFGKLLDIEIVSRKPENVSGNHNLVIVPCVLRKTICFYVESLNRKNIVEAAHTAEKI